MPRRASRPIETVPRYLLTRDEAAASLGMSVKTFRRRVQPFIKIVRQGQLVLISPREIERWVRESERWA
jgi:hypothetical protein